MLTGKISSLIYDAYLRYIEMCDNQHQSYEKNFCENLKIYICHF